MPKEVYSNPAAIEFPDGFTNWQFLNIREALRRYAKHHGKGNLSNSQIANAITSYTGTDMGKDVINRFLTGFYGKDAAGNESQPELRNLQAIASFLLHPDIRELKRKDLEIRHDGYEIPTKLSKFFQLDHVTEEICSQYKKCGAIYYGLVDAGKIIKSITLHIEMPEQGEFFQVKEFIRGKSRNSNELSEMEFKNCIQIVYDGWGLIMPEGYILFLMKELTQGYNQVFISSSKFDFYSSKTLPQEFSALLTDERDFYQAKYKSNLDDPLYMNEKSAIFKKQD